MKTITIKAGLPRSGKTSSVKDTKTTEVIISADQLRLLVYNQRYWAEGESMVFAVRNVMLRALLQQGVNIIVDETNITRDIRSHIIKLARKHGYYIKCDVFATPDTICIERAKLTNQEDLIPIIERMTSQWELPTMTEGFDEINVFGDEY